MADIRVLRWMMDNVFVRQGQDGETSKWIRKNPQRRLTGPLQPLWHLTVQSEMKAVTEACMMTGVFLYSDAAVYDSVKS